MEYEALVLEFFIFLVPLSFGIFTFINFYSRKAKFYEFFYYLLGAIPVLMIFSSVKVILILERGFNASSFLVPNILFLIVESFFVPFFIRYLKHFELLKISKRELIILGIILGLSISTKDYYEAVDFFVYSAVIVYTNITSILLYSANSEKKKNIIMYCIPSLILSIDAIIKLLFYWNIAPLFPSIIISSGFRLVAFCFIVYLAHITGKSFEVSYLPEEVLNYRKNLMKRAILVAIISTIIVVLLILNFYRNFTNYRAQITKETDVSLATSSYIFGTRVSDLIKNNIEDHILYLSLDEKLLDPSQNRKIIDLFYETHQTYFSSITLVNNKGIVEYTVPFRLSIGKDISQQPHVKEVLTKHTISLSDPFIAVQGFPAIALHIPLFKQNEFVGSIAGVVDLRRISDLILPMLETEKNVLVFESNILCGSSRGIFNLLDPEEVIINKDFQDKYLSKTFSFQLHGKDFKVYTYVEKSINETLIANYAKESIIFNFPAIVLILTMLYVFLTTLRKEDIELGRSVEEAVIRERDVSKQKDEYQKKLGEINNFIFEVSLGDLEKSIAEKLLSLFLKVIKNGNMGTVFIRSNDFLIPMATYGYDSSILEKVKIPLEIEKERWGGKEPLIIKDILSTTPDVELKKQFEKVDSLKIKETIVAPIYTEREYYATIYIDSNIGYNIFSQEDMQVAKAISRIARFYFENREILGDLKDEAQRNLRLTEKLQKIIEKTSKFTFLEREESFYKELLDLSMELIDDAERGSVIIRKDDTLEYIASSGYPISLLKKIKIPFKKEIEVVDRGKAILIENVSGKIAVTKEQQKIYEEIGAYSNKRTITASIFVEGDYQGGLFIDSKNENAFNEEDKKVILALSNIASLYERTRRLLKEVEKNNLAQNIIVRSLKKVWNVQKREELLDIIYSEISKNLPFEISEMIIIYSSPNYKYECNLAKGKVKIREITELPIFLYNYTVATLIDNPRKELVSILSEKKNPKSLLISPQGNLFFIYSSKKPLKKDEVEILNSLSFGIREILENKELTFEIKENYIETLVITVKAIDSRDPYTKEHSENVTKYAYLIGQNIGFSENMMKNLALSALLHDIGKIGIQDSILKKPTILTRSEYEEIKRHPIIGWKMLKETKLLKREAEFVLYHHERFDGKGYPKGLKGNEIPLLSRIISVADAFDAMTTERPYRKAKTLDEAKKELLEFKGSQFDPEIVDIFLKTDFTKINEIDILQILREVFIR